MGVAIDGLRLGWESARRSESRPAFVLQNVSAIVLSRVVAERPTTLDYDVLLQAGCRDVRAVGLVVRNQSSSLIKTDDDVQTLVEEVFGNAAAVGWNVVKDMQPAARPLVAIGIAGNVGRFGGSCVEWVPGSPGHYRMVSIHPRHHTQEESIVANMVNAGTAFLSNGTVGQLLVPWGLVDPLGLGGETLQAPNADYRRTANDTTIYRHAVSVRGRACHQERNGDFERGQCFSALAVFTGGPNAGWGGRGSTSTMTRTLDPATSDYRYFTRAIMQALAAMFDEMVRQNATVAVVPGLSTGLYAGVHRDRITAAGEFVGLIREALQLDSVDRAASFDRIIYAHYAARPSRPNIPEASAIQPLGVSSCVDDPDGPARALVEPTQHLPV